MSHLSGPGLHDKVVGNSMKLRGFPGLLLLAAVLLFVLPSAAGFYTDWLWFQELGYEGVFLRTLNAQSRVFAATFAAVFVFLYFNLKFARRRAADRPRVVLGTSSDGRPISVDGRQVAGAAMPIALVMALLVGLMGASQWLTWLAFLNAAPFNIVDPLFKQDVSFYIFKLPIYQLVRQQALLVTVVALIGCTLLYVFSGSFVIEARPGASAWPRIRLVPAARRHLSLLTALVLGLLAWGASLGDLRHAADADRRRVSPSVRRTRTSTPAFRFSGPRLRSWPWVRRSRCGTASGGEAGRCRWRSCRTSRCRPRAASTAAPCRRLIVTPNEQEKERPYIEYNIQATREAYALDRVEERESLG